jgi:hypothetical protein
MKVINNLGNSTVGEIDLTIEDVVRMQYGESLLCGEAVSISAHIKKTGTDIHKFKAALYDLNYELLAETIEMSLSLPFDDLITIDLIKPVDIINNIGYYIAIWGNANNGDITLKSSIKDVSIKNKIKNIIYSEKWENNLISANETTRDFTLYCNYIPLFIPTNSVKILSFH